MRLTEEQAGRDRRRSAPSGRRPPRPTVPALEAHAVPGDPGAGPRLRPGDRLHGRRCGDRAGGAGVLWAGHAAGLRGCRADPLPDAPPALHAVRDVRDQVPREAADLRRAAVDPPPHRQRERVFRALFDPGPRVLPAGAGASGGAVVGQPAGPRRRAGRRGGRARARPAARGCDALLRPLRRDAERGRDGGARAIRRARAWRANWRG